MSQPDGKVVALGDHPRARARLSSQESASVLDGCRSLALDRMAGALGGMLDKVEDELFALADKAVDRDERNLYLDARAQARDRRAAIEATFRRHFVECFDRKVRGETAVPSRPVASGELSLVEHSDLEETLALREMSHKLKAACEGELYALSRRMGFLLERPELEDEANPVSPATIFAALKGACDEIPSDFRVRMTLLRQIERHAEEEIRRVYHDLNDHLVERRILPDVRTALRRPSAAPTTARPAQPAAERDLFATLSQLVGAAAGAAAGPAPAAPVVAELTRLHRDGSPPGPADVARMQDMLRNLKAGPLGERLGAVDAMTIDIVAMIFDYVFEDRHIPTAVKALLGRLQIPTLKVALMDKTFFSSRSHPTRHLIDLLAQASIGLGESHDRGDATLALVEEVVDRVLAEFDTDLAVFESMAAKVQAFIEAQERAEEALVERSARLVESRERREAAMAAAHEAVAGRLDARAAVPPAVREMLERHWTEALADVHQSEGEGSNAWLLLCRTMDDLLWSVEAKGSAEDRRRLVATLPTLLRQLDEGIARSGMDERARDLFFGALVDCHAMAVKAGLRGLATLSATAAPARDAAAVAATAERTLQREIVPAGELRVEEIRLRSGRGVPVRNVYTRTGVWTNLQRGTWVEFTRPDAAPVRARLTWISPDKGVYLFTSPMSGSVALSVTPEALAEQLRLGEARMLNDAPLVERAVNSMMVSLGARDGASSAA